MNLKDYINEYYNSKLENDKSYTYEQAIEEVISKLHKKNNKNIL